MLEDRGHIISLKTTTQKTVGIDNLCKGRLEKNRRERWQVATKRPDLPDSSPVAFIRAGARPEVGA